MTIANAILKKCTRGSFHLWVKDDYDLAVTVLQKPAFGWWFWFEPGKTPSCILTWKPSGFLSHIKCPTNDDRFPLSLWEAWYCSTLGVPIPASIGPSQECACNAFHYDSYGVIIQTCQVKSAVSQAHDWVVYKLGGFLGSVGYRVKVHKITPATGKERGDLELKDYVVLLNPQEQADRLPPPRTSNLHPIGQLTHTRRSDGVPEPDGASLGQARAKIIHYRQVYLIDQTQ
jgi:hypothetical protein